MLPQQKCGRLACTIDWNFISVEMGFDFWPRSYFWSTLNLEAMEAMVLATCAQIRYVLVATVSGR